MSFLEAENRTIAAIATPSGAGGIGIIRMSGNGAFEIASRHFRKGNRAVIGQDKFAEIPANMLSYGYYVLSDGSDVDEIMLVKMQAPHSFTCEDVVEFQCHGGLVVMREILNDLLADGAVLAEPGEFTKRAFLNGRIDLSQAEAVMDLISAKSKSSSRIAMNALQGRLSEKINEAKDVLVALMAQLEVNADYPEYDVEMLTAQQLSEGLAQAKGMLTKLLKTYDRGKMLRNGVTIAITGRPNVGKSSLMNILAGHEKAIVSDIPGTTRDPLEEYIDLNGIPVKIVDTAGIRESDNVIEQLGVDRARDIVAAANIAILMIDATRGVEEADLKLFKELICENKIVLINKMDAVDEEVPAVEELSDAKIIYTSMKTELGLEEFYEALGELTANTTDDTNDVILTNSRHMNLIEKAIKDLEATLGAIESGMPNDCSAIDIIEAMNALGEITGDSIRDDIANEIFSRFCIGK